MINDIYICRTRVFKIVLFLTLLNYLRLFKSTKIIYTSKNVFFQKKKNYPKIWGLSLVGGPRRWPKWPRPRAGPVHESQLLKLSYSVYNLCERNTGPLIMPCALVKCQRSLSAQFDSTYLSPSSPCTYLFGYFYPLKQKSLLVDIFFALT